MAAVGALLVEARPFRPFRSSSEYVYAMKEDLAEWLTGLYPELRVSADNFLDRLDSGVALCRHANAVRAAASSLAAAGRDAAESDEALELARALRARPPVSLLPAARPGTFFARDNLSNFIDWCRRALGVLECLLFETDDLCLRKNEKHVVLCLLEVARRGARLGMPAPLLVQMERQIDRELAGEDVAHAALGLAPASTPQQVVTNDLRSLDERVRDLLARCSCPTQFPMVRVSEGKYRIGDTKILIFVRILRSHVMVRVGGGWDTLAHYLDKHDPCRCRAAHRASLAARLRPASARPYAPLAGALVLYDREPLSLPALCTPADAAEPPRESASRSASPGGGGGGSRLSVAPHASPRRTPPPPPPPASESASDNGSELSDEGYRSLGLPPAPPAPPHQHSDTAAAEPERVSESTGLRRTDYSHSLYGGPAGASGPAGPAGAPPSPPRASPARAHSTWSSGRHNRSRPRLSADTYRSPPRAPASPAPLSPAAPSAFKRNSPLRASCSALRSPAASAAPPAAPAHKALSPLLQHILRSAENDRDDAAVLEKVKRIIRQYSDGGGGGGGGGGAGPPDDPDSLSLTSAWVTSHGRLERSASSRQLSPAPRRPRPAAPDTRIPAPVRLHP